MKKIKIIPITILLVLILITNGDVFGELANVVATEYKPLENFLVQVFHLIINIGPSVSIVIFIYAIVKYIILSVQKKDNKKKGTVFLAIASILFFCFISMIRFSVYWIGYIG